MSAVGWQRVEGGLVFLAALAGMLALSVMGRIVPWWLLVIVFFAPDIGFLGYLLGPRIGAAVYNLLHLYGAGLVLVIAGLLIWGGLKFTIFGLLWMGHVGFDRMLGYGLKEPSGFGDTHLGRIGRQADQA